MEDEINPKFSILIKLLYFVIIICVVIIIFVFIEQKIEGKPNGRVTIYFDTNSSKIPISGATKLLGLCDVLEKNNFDISIYAYSDSTGTRKDNKKISNDRRGEVEHWFYNNCKRFTGRIIRGGDSNKYPVITMPGVSEPENRIVVISY